MSFQDASVLQMTLEIALLNEGMVAMLAMKWSQASVLADVCFYIKQLSVSLVAVNALQKLVWAVRLFVASGYFSVSTVIHVVWILLNAQVEAVNKLIKFLVTAHIFFAFCFVRLHHKSWRRNLIKAKWLVCKVHHSSASSYIGKKTRLVILWKWFSRKLYGNRRFVKYWDSALFTHAHERKLSKIWAMVIIRTSPIM